MNDPDKIINGTNYFRNFFHSSIQQRKSLILQIFIPCGSSRRSHHTRLSITSICFHTQSLTFVRALAERIRYTCGLAIVFNTFAYLVSPRCPSHILFSIITKYLRDTGAPLAGGADDLP
ncbi:hypothetical protein BOTBODRAFT_326217 [Botryobasidium botryosum FD-172 SS1]|uniref:Uncharacterized protein n=1 Tax=Botryobasidium botryosum (strain FD-172 SS1) TaxID=930990 RepID=A0A067MZI4_BOTB1|nr:hypothetical protein BOTBODRAFT_326217 [Botryobasidium botryosum FD-172 SS1]